MKEIIISIVSMQIGAFIGIATMCFFQINKSNGSSDTVSYTHLRTGRRFKMSDKVKIKVSAASKREKTIDFQIVGMKSNKKKKKTVIINKRRDRKPKQKFKRKRR